ncbi:nucleolar protein 58 [Triticum aestivum]|uniref:nucleolar protein 58 n=1 Tax=Triticum aestivum TaxID=4565 RepID=UPI001D01342B|nr:nucleolar protein 58-like [Triticum aestivum]
MKQSSKRLYIPSPKPCYPNSKYSYSAEASSAAPSAGAAPAPPTSYGNDMPARPHRQKKPKAGLKLNFDGSSKGKSGSATIGGVYRDGEGNFLLGYAGRIGKATSSVAELVALKYGLKLAVKNRWSDISIEGDFKAAVDAIASRARFRAKEDKEQFTEIAKMLPRLGKVSVRHVGRAGNRVAHCFANLGHKTAQQRLWREAPPAEVLLHLQRDAEVPSKKKKKNEEGKKKKKRDAKDPSKKKKDDEEKKNPKKNTKRDAMNPSKKKKRKRDTMDPCKKKKKKKKNEEKNQKKKRKRGKIALPPEKKKI